MEPSFSLSDFFKKYEIPVEFWSMVGD